MAELHTKRGNHMRVGRRQTETLTKTPSNNDFRDVDFIPSATLYSRLVSLYLPRLAEVRRAAVVIPHFETLAAANLDGSDGDQSVEAEVPRIPQNFAEMKQGLHDGKAVPFHSIPEFVVPSFASSSQSLGTNYSRKWPQGIASSNYSQWYKESQHGLFGFIRIRPDTGPYEYGVRFWEPFVLARRVEPPALASAGDAAAARALRKQLRESTRQRRRNSARTSSDGSDGSDGSSSNVSRDDSLHTLPRYSEAYVGRFRNKVAFISSLRSHQYVFYTLLQEFVSHFPHPVGNASSEDSKAMKKIMWRVDDMYGVHIACCGAVHLLRVHSGVGNLRVCGHVRKCSWKLADLTFEICYLFAVEPSLTGTRLSWLPPTMPTNRSPMAGTY